MPKTGAVTDFSKDRDANSLKESQSRNKPEKSKFRSLRSDQPKDDKNKAKPEARNKDDASNAGSLDDSITD